MKRTNRIFGRTLIGIFSAAFIAPLAGCGDGRPAAIEDVGATSQALAVPGALSDAYAAFLQMFADIDGTDFFHLGLGFNPALVTEKITVGGHHPRGAITFDFVVKHLQASLSNVPDTGNFDLWFVKNVAGSGRTILPESGDQLLKVGTFTGSSGNTKSLDVALSANIASFDLDMVVVTRKGQSPTASRIAMGSRTLFEKAFFRDRAGLPLDPVGTPVAKDVETTDKLVARGAELFFHETFGGNGRTCGTCHRAEHSLTIDPAFIATLPQSDPLFVAENNPALAQLEDPVLLRQRGLIRENMDAFTFDTTRFVQRGVPHTLALSLTNGFDSAQRQEGALPPDELLGWSGDGAPGRGTLNEFAVGAIFQHFTKTLNRKPGTDFRIPTQEEVDALEAFQLFSGRQKVNNVNPITFREPRAQSGKTLFLTVGCAGCHVDLVGSLNNFMLNTGVFQLTPDLPFDDGFLDTTEPIDSGVFNVPPLAEAADTAPFFHNNGAATIEDAVAFYTTDFFANSHDGFPIVLTVDQQSQVGDFLRVVNAAENLREVRKRVQFVHDHRSSGNTGILTVAIADTGDAIRVLSEKGLNAAARNELADVKTTLQIAQANADADRVPFMDHALNFLGLAKTELFADNPNNDF